MRPDLVALLPKDKLEIEEAEAIVAIGFPAIEPVLPALVEWMQDMNWPVAQALQPFLAGIGVPLAPHVRHVLETTDELWKYWVLRCIVRESPDLAQSLRAELLRLAEFPTVGECGEEVDVQAREILQSYGNTHA